MKQSGWILLLIAFLANACSPNNVENEKSWEKYFAEYKVEGCFMLFNNSQGTFKVYNLERAQERFLPASTFKIFNALVGLETGVIKDTSYVIPWDGVTRSISDWNQNLSMQQAFRLSSVPYFQEVARRVTKPVMQQWLDTIKYGNMKISKIDTFWLDNSLQISPDEQLGFVKKLYFDQLPFHKVTMQNVRQIMRMETKPEYELSYKTGMGVVGRKTIAWITGWIEEAGHPTFFVLNLETENSSLNVPDVRMKILRNILADAGYFKGLK
ncbi:class D beta-lactamase [Chitinophaga rhizophila]|uniref:beta-lactamase n=1 Tax=Chitinophaga rhizophila TaxID=2866212 RepID=A0ABS7GEY6_9BACT|nr:class D beta-lactamase [Chitinophaga rhizophila]MBW8686258.1 class D beta-lactamase [Chitinophaga rhizophila]